MDLYLILFISAMVCIILLAIAWGVWAWRKKAWNLCPPTGGIVESSSNAARSMSENNSFSESPGMFSADTGDHSMEDHLASMTSSSASASQQNDNELMSGQSSAFDYSS